jgi:hypothetical protein
LEIAPKNVNCVSSIKEGTADGEWEITVQEEKVSLVKSIKFLGLHLKYFRPGGRKKRNS